MTILDKMESDSLILDVDKIHVWESVLNTPIVLNNINEINIEPVVANSYIGDMYGLLHNHVGISNSLIYINIRINDYKSSLDYDGVMSLKILDPEIAEEILDMILGE